MRRKQKPQPRRTVREPRFEGCVRDLTSRGMGVVAHPDGRIFFVPGVWLREQGVFEVVNHRGRGGEARLIELLEASPERRGAPCVHHGFAGGSCGGCPWMFISYEQQLEAKQRRVEQTLAALGCEVSPMPLLESAQVLGYRNRAQVKTDGRELGFVTPSAAKIAPVRDCLILSDHNRETLRQLRAQLPNKDWRPTRKQNWTTLEFDDRLAPGALIPNRKRPFMQGNSAQNQRMREWLADTLDSISHKSLLVELFAGSGNFTDIAVAAGVDAVFAVESFAPAVEALRARNLPGVTVQLHDLYSPQLETALERHLVEADVLLLDPPRDGLKTLGNYLQTALKLRWVIYISCDLATFSRDVKSAMDHGFVLERVQALDLFPQTPHVELLSVLHRRIASD